VTFVQDSAQKNSDQKLFDQMLQVRLMEMEAREEILKAIAIFHDREIWKREGYRSLQAFCLDRLGYDRVQAREIAIEVGAILVTDRIRVETPEAQFRFETLREWRRLLARSKGVPSFRIFSNRMLLDLASTNPQTIDDLKKIKGFGLKRLEAFGPQLVSHLRDVNLPGNLPETLSVTPSVTPSNH
jgi:superfamily II DNA helicase RecQ